MIGQIAEDGLRTESYVVRIYRRGRGKRRSVVGIVEAARSGWQKPFQSLQELAEILATPDAPSPHRISRNQRTG